MRAAGWPRASVRAQKLVLIQPGAAPESRLARELPELLGAGNLLVLNDAATFPASLRASTFSGKRLELRLLPKRPGAGLWEAIVFGDGSWREKTEERPAPPELKEGCVLALDGGRIRAEVRWVSEVSSRWVKLAFDRSERESWQEIYRQGKAIQYSYLERELDLWLAQTAFASRPWASEMPSAGRFLSWSLILELRRKGVRTEWLTHSTGISSTGDPKLDALLPFPEFFLIPESTVRAVSESRARGARVIAAGTSVTRALEGCALDDGILRPGPGETDLVIQRGFRPRIVDGILTGVHEMGESHFRLLEAFASRAALEKALELADRSGYLTHEFGDSCLILT